MNIPNVRLLALSALGIWRRRRYVEICPICKVDLPKRPKRVIGSNRVEYDPFYQHACAWHRDILEPPPWANGRLYVERVDGRPLTKMYRRI